MRSLIDRIGWGWGSQFWLGLVCTLTILLVVAGCQSAFTDMDQKVYKARVVYDGTILNLAHQYWGLPLCSETADKVCQNEEVGLKIADADRVVERAFNDAETCVRTNPDCQIDAVMQAINGATAEVSRQLNANGITSAWLAGAQKPSS